MWSKLNNLFVHEEDNKTGTKENVNKISEPKELIQEALDSEIFTNQDDTIKVTKPQAFADSKYIAEILLSGRVIILTLNDVGEDTGQRILDFVMGICYSQNIAIERFEKNKWLINPANKLHERALYEEKTSSSDIDEASDDEEFEIN